MGSSSGEVGEGARGCSGGGQGGGAWKMWKVHMVRWVRRGGGEDRQTDGDMEERTMKKKQQRRLEENRWTAWQLVSWERGEEYARERRTVGLGKFKAMKDFSAWAPQEDVGWNLSFSSIYQIYSVVCQKNKWTFQKDASMRSNKWFRNSECFVYRCSLVCTPVTCVPGGHRLSSPVQVFLPLALDSLKQNHPHAVIICICCTAVRHRLSVLGTAHSSEWVENSPMWWWGVLQRSGCWRGRGHAGRGWDCGRLEWQERYSAVHAQLAGWHLVGSEEKTNYTQHTKKIKNTKHCDEW